MSAALKEYRERYRLARNRLLGKAIVHRDPTASRDILRISTPVQLYDEPIGPRVPVAKAAIVPASSWHHARQILREVCAKYGVSTVDLCSKRRPILLVTARHEACYRLRNETTWSYPRIGAFLGGRDHTTIIHAVREHAKRLRDLEAGQ